MRLPFLLTLPRVLRHSAAVGADLPPDEAVVLDAPDAALRTALTSAAEGDHGPARELLAATREHTQWELRDGYVSRLAEAALHNPGWLDAWLAESPRTRTRLWSGRTSASTGPGRYVRRNAPGMSRATSSRHSSRCWRTRPR